MKYLVKSIALVAIFLMASCASQQSLQEYYVDNQQNPNFISVDVPASVLNFVEGELNAKEKEAVQSLRKINLLAFQITEDNKAEYKAEKTKVKEILKNEKFVDLMKLNSPYGKGVIKYLGEEDAINEVIIYGDSKEKGFALVRVLGKKMNPAHIMELVQAIEKSDIEGDQFGDIARLFKN